MAGKGKGPKIPQEYYLWPEPPVFGIQCTNLSQLLLQVKLCVCLGPCGEREERWRCKQQSGGLNEPSPTTHQIFHIHGLL